MTVNLDPALHTSLDALLATRRHCHELPLFTRPVRSGRQTGQQNSRLRGRGVDFDQVRAYLPGDDIRNIDWRVTARSQKVHTKVFNEERERPVFLIGEQSPRLFFGSQRCLKSVLAAETCALIAWTALAHHDRVGGMVFGPGQCHEVRPRRDRKALLQLLQLLVQANHLLTPEPSEPLEPASEALNLALFEDGAIIEVPVKLTFANKASSFPIIVENTKTTIVKNKIANLVLIITALSLPESKLLISVPRANI